MKTSRSLQSILAGVAVGSLLVYVLACSTSFSPDDKQVIYPSFDPQSGATSVSLYDRSTKRCETLLMSARCEPAADRESVLIRAEWLPDGKHILVGQLVDNNALLLTVLPRDPKELVRNFTLADFDEAAGSLQFPFAIVENQLFLNGDNIDPIRLDLSTGAVTGGKTNENPMVVLPAPDGKSLVGLRASKADKSIAFGAYDPATMEFKPVSSLAADGGEVPLPCFNPADGRVIWIVQKDSQLNLQVFKKEKVELTRPLTLPGGTLKTGPFLALAPDGKTVFTAACVVTDNKTNSEYGLLEIPLGDAPLRFTPLFRATCDDDGELIFAQPSLSHDGKTWAICSSYLYRQNHALNSDDCALFLVDVSKAKRPVTKVAIPVPPQREKLIR
jgi:hypothetical protein